MKKKSCGKACVFSHCFFVFFVVFNDFGSILGGLGGSKIEKIAQDAPKVDFGTCLGRIFLRRWVWEGFWHDLGWILMGFLVDFGGCGPHC